MISSACSHYINPHTENIVSTNAWNQAPSWGLLLVVPEACMMYDLLLRTLMSLRVFNWRFL